MAWLDNRFRKRIRFDISNSGGLQTECPTSVVVDTQCLIDAEGMCEDGRDIRIAGADEVTLLPFSVLGGINTPNTEIGVRVDSIPNGTSSVYMYFDYVCESIQSLSDGSFWYTSVTTEQTPELTVRENDLSVKLYIGGSGGSGSITERWSPTFNALNVSGFQFGMSCENTAHTHGSCRHYIDITGGDKFYEEWWYSSCYSIPPPCRADPWTDSIFGSTSNITGVHELNVEVCVHYTFSGMESRLTTTIKITLSNDPSISAMEWGQEDCPTPLPTETFYAKVGGNDGLDGKSYPNAWATLNHAFTNTPADHGNIIRLDEGTYNGFEGGFSPLRCVNLVGGYWDGDWHDWIEGCGHNRPAVIAHGGQIDHDDVSLKYIELDTTMAPLTFPYMPCTYRFINCLYNGMIFAGQSVVILTNTDRIFHQPTGTVLPTSVTPDHHIFVVHDPDAFNTFSPREAMIRSDIDADMIIDTWSTTGDQNKAWRIEAVGSRTVEFIFADMLPDTGYDLKVDGGKVSSAVSDGSGVVAFPPYTGSFSEKVFETEKSPEVAFVPRVTIF